jgi:acyl-CoA synthetase (NDP forming)
VPERRDLRALFDPSSVAVVGASDEPHKWGHWLAKGALEGEHRRSVYLVNRRGGSVLGRSAYPSIEALPEAPELVVLSIPAAFFEEAVAESLAKGAQAIVGITAGLAETGESGRASETAAARMVREAGAVLLGPNCLGHCDNAAELYLSSERLPPGGIGLISQSGNLALELGVKAREVGVGFARFASVGNQADIEVADLVEDFAASDGVELIAVYCEDFRNGRRFVEAASLSTESGKPVVLLAAGSSSAAARAARSHTGALVSAGTAVAAACRAAGIEQVRTPKELIDVAQALGCGVLPKGRRVGIVADGGGHGAIAADVAEAAGLDVPAFSAGLSLQLAEATRTTGGNSNPVDLAGAGEQDIWSFSRVVSALVASGEIDALLLTGYFGGYGGYSPAVAAGEREVASAIADLVASSGTPLVVHTMHVTDVPDQAPDDAGGPIGRLRRRRVPVYWNVEDAASCLSRLVRRAGALSAPLRPGNARLSTLCDRPAVRAESGYFGARALLEAHGFPFVPARRAGTLEMARKAAVDLGYPVAVKAVELEHKSDAGAVVLGVSSDEELDSVVGGLLARFPETALSVEAMASLPSSVELLVGAVRDPRFGPVVLVGLGGIYTEVLADTATALAPVSVEEAAGLVSELRAAPLLLGARGRPRLDVEGAARAVAALSEAAMLHPEITELEVNPLVVGPDGVYGVDARIVVEPT